MPEMASCVPVATGVLHANGPSHVEVIPCRSAASQTFIPVRIVTRLWLEGSVRVCCCEDLSMKPPQIAGWLGGSRICAGYPGRRSKCLPRRWQSPTGCSSDGIGDKHENGPERFPKCLHHALISDGRQAVRQMEAIDCYAECWLFVVSASAC